MFYTWCSQYLLYLQPSAAAIQIMHIWFQYRCLAYCLGCDSAQWEMIRKSIRTEKVPYIMVVLWCRQSPSSKQLTDFNTQKQYFCIY